MWKSQLEDELSRMEDQQKKLDETRELCISKIAQATELLDKMGYVAPVEEAEVKEAVSN
jgi:uncharacterized membrane-anchored protein YhcB (DUF1043 family)